MNNNLRGIVIDAGHGGSDPGAVSGNNYEKDYALAMSKYLYDRFRELGIPVTLTRDNDETLNPTDRVNNVLNAFGNGEDVIVLSNHLNAGGGLGAEIIYSLRNDDTLANNILNNIGDTGQSVRRVYQRRLTSDPTKDYYFILRNTANTEPVIIEYGFIDNPEDYKFLQDNFQRLGEAVVKAVLEYKGIPYENEIVENYIVKKGDTLYSISNKFGTTIDNIKKANNLVDNTLSINQLLIIPVDKPPIDKSLYSVKKGDTLYSIAKEFDTTVNDIIELNELSTNVLSIGQLLKIPSSSLDEVNTYIVKSGDTLYKIAGINNTTVDELKYLNNLTSDILTIGQTLIIPKDTDYYVVKKGDSLYSIAKRFNTTVDNLKRLNNLNSNLINIGQNIKIK